MKTLLSGNKFNSRHQTYIPESASILKSLKEHTAVKKIFLGKITRTKKQNKSGSAGVKVKSMDGNLVSLKIRGKDSVMDIRFVIKEGYDLDTVLKEINDI